MTKFLIAYGNAGPHIQQAAKAIDELNMLAYFCTTFVDEPTATWQKMIKVTAESFGYDLAKQLKRRSVWVVNQDRLVTFPSGEIAQLLVHKVIGNKVWGDKVFHWARDRFDNGVSGLVPKIDAVYTYENCALETLRVAKDSGKFRVLDLPAPEHDFSEDIINEQLDYFPSLRSDYRTYVKALQHKRTDYRRKEWELANLAICNSELTRQTWLSRGWSTERVAVVPYGAPPVKHVLQRESNFQRSPKFVWAGTFGVRKGAHLLLDAWSEVRRRCKGATIDVYGANILPNEIKERLPEGVNLKGSVPQAELFHAFSIADALIFPTLCDGFGMVVTEALSFGLPVITTRRAGAADLIIDGKNGLIIDHGSASAIVEGIERFMDMQPMWQKMKEHARQTAAGWQWSDYRKRLGEILSERLAEYSSSSTI